MANEKRLILLDHALQAASSEYFSSMPEHDLALLVTIRKKLKALPTVDAVEVVRCKECKWYGVDMDKGQFCKQHKSPSMWTDGITPLKPDDFCSYGERRNDGV